MSPKDPRGKHPGLHSRVPRRRIYDCRIRTQVLVISSSMHQWQSSITHNPLDSSLIQHILVWGIAKSTSHTLPGNMTLPRVTRVGPDRRIAMVELSALKPNRFDDCRDLVSGRRHTWNQTLGSCSVTQPKSTLSSPHVSQLDSLMLTCASWCLHGSDGSGLNFAVLTVQSPCIPGNLHVKHRSANRWRLNAYLLPFTVRRCLLMFGFSSNIGSGGALRILCHIYITMRCGDQELWHYRSYYR